MKKITLLFLLFSVFSKAQTVGLTQHTAGSTDNGYVLFAPISSNTTYLMDKCGFKVKSWSSSYRPAISCYLLPDGTLLRTGNTNNTTFTAGGKGGVIEKIDWNGTVVWSYTLSSASQCQHHDVQVLPNGNILVIVWEAKTAGEAIAQGRNPAQVPATLWSEKIIEIQPSGNNGGTIVWEWHLWDHLVQDFDSTKANYGVVNTNPQAVNINFNSSATNADWIHFNSVAYNATLNQIVLSSHGFDEVWIIDHSTTTAQAATQSGGNSEKGGSLLYRWGNPSAYNTTGTQKLFGQHDAHWIENGLPFQDQIMIFNNGNGRPGGNYSTVEIINPPLNGFNYTATLPYLPTNTSWSYNQGNPNALYAQNISGAQQLANGNVLYCSGPSGTFTEVNTAGTSVWNYINPVGNATIASQGTTPLQNSVFRASFYENTFSGFANHTLTAGATIENTNSLSANCVLLNTTPFERLSNLKIFPNPTASVATITTKNQPVEHLAISNMQGQLLFAQSYSNQNTVTVDLSSYQNGLYMVTVNNQTTLKVLKK
jgi:hypothetical protein